MSNKKSIQIYFNLNNTADEKLYSYLLNESNKSLGVSVSTIAKGMIYDNYKNHRDENTEKK